MTDIIKIDAIRLDGGTQTRGWMDQDNVADYAELMKNGVVFPPVQIIYDGENYWLTDGFHRVSAAKKAGIADIAADITPGTLQDAQWASYAANKSHGLRRNRHDTQRAIDAALLHPNGANLSDRQIAEYIGCSHPTVGSRRAHLVATGKITSQDERTGKDGRTINTQEIGLKHQVEQWGKLILKPWIEQFKGADLVLVHKGGEYLHSIADENDARDKALLKDKYHFRYSYYAPHAMGYSAAAYGVIVDKGYVELFERSGLKVHIEEYGDLDQPLLRGIKAAFNTRTTINRYTYKQVDQSLRPGDLVATKEKSAYGSSFYIGEVVGISDSFVHARRAGEDKHQIWFGEHLCSVDEARSIKLGRIEWLSWGQRARNPEFSWLECHRQNKHYYSPENILIVKSENVYLAFSDDAIKLAELLNRESPVGILAHRDETGPVFVTFDTDAVDKLSAEIPMMGYDTGNQELKQFWNSIIAASAAQQQPKSVIASTPAEEIQFKAPQAVITRTGRLGVVVLQSGRIVTVEVDGLRKAHYADDLRLATDDEIAAYLEGAEQPVADALDASPTQMLPSNNPRTTLLSSIFSSLKHIEGELFALEDGDRLETLHLNLQVMLEMVLGELSSALEEVQ